MSKWPRIKFQNLVLESYTISLFFPLKIEPSFSTEQYFLFFPPTLFLLNKPLGRCPAIHVMENSQDSTISEVSSNINILCFQGCFASHLSGDRMARDTLVMSKLFCIKFAKLLWSKLDCNSMNRGRQKVRKKKKLAPSISRNPQPINSPQEDIKLWSITSSEKAVAGYKDRRK